MQFEIKLDPAYQEPHCIILTAKMSDEVQALVQRLSEAQPDLITGLKDEKIEVLEINDLIQIYASEGKVFALNPNGKYLLKLRLYEVEKRLPTNQFVRISNSEIINLKNVKNFDLSITGTICVKLSNGNTTYVSRRCVAKIRKILGI